MADYFEVGEPTLSFHVTEPRYRNVNPIAGLQAWGPYDASVPGYLRPNPLRIAVICSERSFGAVLGFIRRIAQGANHNSPDEYVIDWPGFRQVFQTNLEYPQDSTNSLVRLVAEKDVEQARHAVHPEIAFLEILKNHLRSLLPVRHEFDVVIIHIPERWSAFRECKDEDYYFDLHDALKVFGAPNNICIQLVYRLCLTRHHMTPAHG